LPPPPPPPPPVPVTIDHVGNLAPAPATYQYSDIWAYVDPGTGREYALLGLWNRDTMYVIDASDPSAPALVSTVAVPAFDMKTWQHYAYTVTGSGGHGPEEGRIVDLSDPAAPVVVGQFPSSHNLFIDSQGFMYLEFPGLRIYDLRADPLNPQLVWQTSPNNGHDATVVGDWLYDAAGFGNTNIYDVSDRSSPMLVGTVAHPAITYHHNVWPSSDGNYLFVTDEFAQGTTDDITIWDITEPDDPVQVAAIVHPTATVHNVAIRGSLAFISYYADGFRVYDVADPEHPELRFEYDTSLETGDGYWGAWGVYPFTPSETVYVSDIDTGLHLFRVRRGGSAVALRAE
jgi:choice-of-anchor B domain-containing protein